MADNKFSPVTTETAIEHGLFRYLLGGGLFAALFYFASYAFEQLIDDVVESKYQWVAERFALSVSHIHTEWMVAGKPQQLTLNYHVNAKESAPISVHISNKGWPLSVNTQRPILGCLNLWMLFAHEEAHTESVMDLTSHLEITTKSHGCEYYYAEDGNRALIFSYNLNNGKVDAASLPKLR